MMIGIVLVAALAFFVFSLGRRVRPAVPEGADRRTRADAPPPIAIVLAIALLLGTAAILVWQLPNILAIVVPVQDGSSRAATQVS